MSRSGRSTVAHRWSGRPASPKTTRGDRTRAPQGAFPVFALCGVPVIATGLAAGATGLAGPAPVWIALFGWVGFVVIAHVGLVAHSRREFGPANAITTLRGAIAVSLLVSLPVLPSLAAEDPDRLWPVVAAVVFALLLDGIDGHVARVARCASAAGARYDMEVDAFMVLVLCTLVWQLGDAGSWVLGIGLMRYAYAAIARVVPALRRELYPSLRRKAICVLQVVGLCLMLTPWLESPWSDLLGAIALTALAGSFLRDIHWALAGDGSRAG